MSWREGVPSNSLLPEAWVNRWAHSVVGVEINPAVLPDPLLGAVPGCGVLPSTHDGVIAVQYMRGPSTLKTDHSLHCESPSLF